MPERSGPPDCSATTGAPPALREVDGAEESPQ